MIFPDWGTAPETASEAALPLFQEWAVDWDGKSFALRGGEPYLVSGDEALKIWVTRALRPESERFRYTAWSPDYGNELAALLVQLLVYGVYVLLLSCTLAAVHALHTPPRSDPGFCLGEA